MAVHEQELRSYSNLISCYRSAFDTHISSRSILAINKI